MLPSATERLTARARQMLSRYGVLTREAVMAEGVEGGFSSIYPVLKGMEEAGQLRRGYFVAGLGATQFALPGAVERLRQLRQSHQPGEARTPDGGEGATAVILSATDPANPYGAALPWPKSGDGQESRRPGRAAGAIVVLVDGALAAWIGRGERHLVTFFDEVKDRAVAEVALLVARALAEQVKSGRRRDVIIRDIDGAPARESKVAQALVEAGFAPGSEGYVKRHFA
jgi:ATP-dependent Lhr-like helicase